MKYIIKIDQDLFYEGSEEKQNIWGTKCANGTLKEHAKRYNTRAKAEHTMNRLIRTCVNATNAVVEEIDE